MARNRTLSPKVWDHVKLSRMGPVPRLLYIGLISLADDAGNVLAEPFFLWRRLFAGDTTTTEADVTAARAELTSSGVIEMYEVDGVEYIHHPKWTEYQSMNRMYKAKWPLAPGQEYERTPSTYKLSPKTATEPSGEPKQLRMKPGPSEQDLAAYDLMRACYAVIRGHMDVPMSEKMWSARNKAAALDLLASGKTKNAIVPMLQVALSHPEARKYYGTMNRLDKLAEAWPRLEAFARNPRGTGRPAFERLPLVEGEAS